MKALGWIGCLLVALVHCFACSASNQQHCAKLRPGALMFPQQVTTRVLQQPGEADRLFQDPSPLEFQIGAFEVDRDHIRASALITNKSPQPFALVVNPYGGKFPYGGDNPFLIGFAPGSEKTVSYSGQRFPPEPPLPMLIQIPASSSVQFEAVIDLGNYTYSGAPTVTVDWGFHYYKGDHPQGKKQVALPARD